MHLPASAGVNCADAEYGYMCRRFTISFFRALPRKMTRPRNVMTLMIRQMTHADCGVQPAGIVNAEEQQNVRQNADADVHEQIHERVCCKAAAQEGKNKVADQRYTAQNRHDEVQACTPCSR